jgi:hypothetical protein
MPSSEQPVLENLRSGISPSSLGKSVVDKGPRGGTRYSEAFYLGGMFSIRHFSSFGG